MHLTKEPRRNSEASLEGIRKATGRSEANLGGDKLERNAARQQEARFIEPKRLNKLRRRRPGCLNELPMKGAIREIGAGREGVDIQLFVKV